MGCATSKQKRCPHCRNSMTQRSNSLHAHQSPPPPRHSDGYHHVVAFSSSTLGSLKLENIHFDNKIYTAADDPLDAESKETKNEISMGLIEAKTWSNMINERIPKIAPKTPITTPPGEPETINVWEVMEGLDDISPFRPSNRPRSFSFDVGRTPICDSLEQGNSNSNLLEINDSSTSPKPFSLKTTDLDPEVISSFRRSLEELPPEDPFHLRQPEDELAAASDSSSEGKIEKVVVYFTSLRGVRKTYEECCEVRMILKSMGARVDERDVSMDSGFKQELKERLGDGFGGGGLPRVFVGERYIGGAEEIRRLHEDGVLEEVLQGCEKVEEGGGGGGDGGGSGGGGCCEGCGDVRFVPCETCSGSCKIYCEEDEEEGEECGFQRCPDCNENGLIRCPICCS